VKTVALTGASGFVGRQVLEALLRQGCTVRALVRDRHQIDPRPGLVPVLGRLESPEALNELVRGCDAVIHLAGATGGRDYAEFAEINVAGTERLIEAARSSAPSARFIHLSSLAARHSELSDYAASKHAGEQAVETASLDWVVLRPPAVYGPDDPALAPLWQALARGWLIRTGPADARFSLIHVHDLAAALVELAGTPEAARGMILELHDGRVGGYGWADLIAIAETRAGRRIRTLPVAPGLLRIMGWANLRWAILRGTRPPPLVPGKVRELVHHDWVCDNTALPGCPEWAPALTLDNALQDLPGWRTTDEQHS